MAMLGSTVLLGPILTMELTYHNKKADLRYTGLWARL